MVRRVSPTITIPEKLTLFNMVWNAIKILGSEFAVQTMLNIARQVPMASGNNNAAGLALHLGLAASLWMP